MDYGRPSNFRASVYPTAQLNSPPSPPPARAYTASGLPLTPAMLRLLDKQRENQAFERIAQQAEGLKELFDKFGEQYVNAQEGSKAVAGVVEHWQNVFRVTHLALASLEAKKVPPPADWEDQTPILPPGTMPDRIVRIPTEDAALANGDDADRSVF